MKSRLAAISLGYNQPQTHPRVGTKKLGRSVMYTLSLALVQKLGPVRATVFKARLDQTGFSDWSNHILPVFVRTNASNTLRSGTTIALP
jgi:hypothetical protein